MKRESDESAAEDFEYAKETWKELNNPQPEGPGLGPCGEKTEECNYPDCECFHSETIMLSSGYAEVYADGSVVSGGKEIFNVS